MSSIVYYVLGELRGTGHCYTNLKNMLSIIFHSLNLSRCSYFFGVFPLSVPGFSPTTSDGNAGQATGERWEMTLGNRW